MSEEHSEQKLEWVFDGSRWQLLSFIVLGLLFGANLLFRIRVILGGWIPVGRHDWTEWFLLFALGLTIYPLFKFEKLLGAAEALWFCEVGIDAGRARSILGKGTLDFSLALGLAASMLFCIGWYRFVRAKFRQEPVQEGVDAK